MMFGKWMASILRYDEKAVMLKSTRFPGLDHDLEDVLVVEDVVPPYAHGAVLRARPPHHRVLELRHEVLVQPVAEVLHRRLRGGG